MSDMPLSAPFIIPPDLLASTEWVSDTDLEQTETDPIQTDTPVQSGAYPCPITLRAANDFVQQWHRHNGRTARAGGKFAVGLRLKDELVGVAICGNPLSATYMDGMTLEVLRVCLSPQAPRNSNSLLYGICRRIWWEMGGRRILTYTLTTESGASLRGAGWTCEAEIKGHDPATWGKNDHLESRKYQDIIARRKFRWVSIRQWKQS